MKMLSFDCASLTGDHALTGPGKRRASLEPAKEFTHIQSLTKESLTNIHNRLTGVQRMSYLPIGSVREVKSEASGEPPAQ